jgi:cytidylate kinase
VQDTLSSVRRRDTLDSSRAVSPLRQAEDAEVVDSSDLDIPGVVNLLYGLVKDRDMIDGVVLEEWAGR